MDAARQLVWLSDGSDSASRSVSRAYQIHLCDIKSAEPTPPSTQILAQQYDIFNTSFMRIGIVLMPS
jgi:hypothetical protein